MNQIDEINELKAIIKEQSKELSKHSKAHLMSPRLIQKRYEREHIRVKALLKETNAQKKHIANLERLQKRLIAEVRLCGGFLPLELQGTNPDAIPKGEEL